MGMVANKIEVMLLTEKGEKIHWELWLDNEISTELTNDEHLFDSASTVNEFAESIGKGFKDAFPFDDDDYEPDPISSNSTATIFVAAIRMMMRTMISQS